MRTGCEVSLEYGLGEFIRSAYSSYFFFEQRILREIISRTFVAFYLSIKYKFYFPTMRAICRYFSSVEILYVGLRLKTGEKSTHYMQ